MAKYRFCRNYHDYKKNQVAEGMRMDSESVMIKTPYSTGFVSTIEPLFLGSQRLLIKVK
ncbi:hypothetical protein [Vibrio phage P23]|nr:hypothetical protein [Vibrio phage P23]